MELVIAQTLESIGLDSSNMIGLIAIVMLVCQFITKRIPHDAVGIMGLIRNITKVLGLYASNRITSGLTVQDAIEDAVSPDEPAHFFGAKKLVKTAVERLDIEKIIAGEVEKQLKKLNPFRKTPKTPKAGE